MLFSKPTQQLDQADIQQLIDNQILEKKGLDYKMQFSGGSDSDKKELLYDLTSFANSTGGFIIYGVREEGGIPVEIEGIESDSIDREKLRMESLLQTGVEPRIPGIVMHPILLSSGKSVLVVQIPRSWTAPHMVKIGGASKFYSRNSAGKYQLDVAEIRSAFVMSESLSEKIKGLRSERIGRILADDLPISLTNNPKVILHVIQFSAFDSMKQNNFIFPSVNELLAPVNSYGYSWRLNFDGLLVYTPTDQCGEANTYTQIYRNGIIESVSGNLLQHRDDQYRQCIPWQSLQGKLIDALGRYIQQYSTAGIEPPVLVSVTLLGVKGWKIPPDIYNFSGEPIDRDHLIIPDVLVEDFTVDADIVLKPIFDALWNAAGFEKSQGYNETGRWVGNGR